MTLKDGKHILCKCNICEVEGEIIESTDLVCLKCYDKADAKANQFDKVVDILKIIARQAEQIPITEYKGRKKLGEIAKEALKEANAL